MPYESLNHGRGKIIQVNVAIPLELARRIRELFERIEGRPQPLARAVRWVIDQWERDGERR